ncbi:MAG: chemotaxis protein CheA [Acidobacteriia bacterium]|nr:chemotaxis protein CheA [Terriglobia bacterium]
MNDELAQDPSLIHDFLVESEELLQRVDQDMVALESAPGDAELLNRVFRAVHTIKGTSGFFGFDPILRLCHSVEDVLNSARRAEITLRRPAMDTLLAARDQLGAMLRDIHEGGLKQYSLDAMLEQLRAAQKHHESVVRTNDASAESHPPQPAKLNILPSEEPASALPGNPERPVAANSLEAAAPAAVIPPRPPEVGNPTSSQTMRVDARKLDELINLIGELVLERNRLVQLSRGLSGGRFALGDLDEFLAQSTGRLSFITEELQVAGLRTRMMPIQAVFRKFPRMVRDVARNLNKDAQILMSGEETELDKTMAELISDPLVHLIRNSLDHGIETPDVRVQAGKPRQGTIRLEARQEGDQIVIGLSDDGGGINPDRVGRKAVEKGLISQERLPTLSPREIIDFIFLPGFSTAERAGDLSGRGVGLDVVRSNLKKLNGSIEVDSHPGRGTTVLLRLPLTLVILPVLLVQVREEIYALPLRSVIETAQVNLQHVHRVEGSEILCLRGATVPLLRLADIFKETAGSCLLPSGTQPALDPPAPKVVILGIGEKRVALLVDRLLGQESTVIKPLGNYLRHCPSLAGATISGDGRVRLVLDPAGLLAQSTAPLTRKATA